MAPCHSAPLAACVSPLGCRRCVVLVAACMWLHWPLLTTTKGEKRYRARVGEGWTKEQKEGSTCSDQMFYCHSNIEREGGRGGDRTGNQMWMTSWNLSNRREKHQVDWQYNEEKINIWNGLGQILQQPLILVTPESDTIKIYQHIFMKYSRVSAATLWAVQSVDC